MPESIHEEITKLKATLDEGLVDAMKFDEQGNKSAATRITVMLNNVSKEAKTLRQNVFKIKNAG